VSDQQFLYTGPVMVSTWIGERLQTGKTSRNITNQPL